MSDVLPAIVQGAASITGGLLNADYQQRQYQENLRQNYNYQSQLQKEQADLTRGLSADLAKNSPVWNMQGMKMAGLNPAMAEGSTPVTGSVSGAPSVTQPPPISPNFDFGNIGSSLLQGSQIDLVQGQADKAKEEAEALRIENENKRAGNEAANTITYWEDEDGHKIDDIDKWRESHPNDTAVPVVEYRKGHRGELEAQDVIEELEQRKARRKNEKGEFKTLEVERQYREAYANAQKAVANRQLSNDDIIRAIADTPRVNYQRLQKEMDKWKAEIDKIGIEGAWIKAQTERFKSTDFGRVISAFKDKDLNFTDKVLLTFTWLFNSVNFSAGVHN